MADIFLSYARIDRDKVRGLVPILEAQGWSVFWDATIEPGQRWDKLIATELEAARCVVVVWTQASVLSDWVKDEATRGREREVLVPISLDGTRPPLGFRHVQNESIGDWSSPATEPALQRFLAGVRRIVGTEPKSPSVALVPADNDTADLHETFRFQPNSDGTFTVDYITECGDSFASTYSMAYLIATQAVKGQAQVIEPGTMLVLGVNSPSRAPSLAQYEQALITPYARAYTTHAKSRRVLFGVPGFHQSAAAMAHFDELFCSARSRATRGLGLSFGGWDTHQHHRYFAVPLPHRWWIWGVDVRYGEPLETEQFNYFSIAAEQMTVDDRIIICGPPDNWLSCEFDGWREQQNLQRIIAIAEAASARVVALITGGRREYVHSLLEGTSVHHFEIGGGRSFVYPTHLHKPTVPIRWDPPPVANFAQTAPSSSQQPQNWNRRRTYEEEHHFWFLSRRTGSLTEDARLGAARALYWVENPPQPEFTGASATGPVRVAKPRAFFPSRSRSAILALKNLMFPWSNFSYSLTWGFIYWFITWQFQTLVSRYQISSGKIDSLGIETTLGSVLPFMPLYLTQAMITSIEFTTVLVLLFAFLVGYVATDSAPGMMRVIQKILVGAAHFFAHLVLMFTLSLLVVSLNNQLAVPIEKALDTIYQERSEQAPIVRDVIQEGLEPLQHRQAEPSNQAARQSPTRELIGFVAYPVAMIGFGSLVSGLIWGVYLTVTALCGRCFAEKAFAMLRLKGYRTFVRLRFAPDQLTIYPLGLKLAPAPKRWRKSSEYGAPTELLPKLPLTAELIEHPIAIRHQEG